MENKTVALTNKYGLVFINNKELAVSMADMPKLAAPMLAKGIRFYSTLFYTSYKEIYDGYYPTLKIHKTIRDIFYKDRKDYIKGEGTPFFDIAANDYEQMGLHEIFNNKFTLWELLQREDPQYFTTIELFSVSYDKITASYTEDSIADMDIKNRRYYFLSVLYPVEDPDRFYNAILNFMIYKCWVYGGLNEFVPYDENMPNLSGQ